MRRLGLVVLIALSLSWSSIAMAQDATPEAGLSSLGLPTIDVTVTATAIEGVPASVEAGRYLVNVSVTDENPDGGGVGFIQPVGISADEFVATFSGGGDATPVSEASPVDETDTGGGDEVPPFIFQSTFAGGIYAGPGMSDQIVIDLTPGEWVAWGDDPEAPWAPVAFDVTGEMPADITEPASTATLTMGEYVINVTEGALTAGTQIIKVENIGAQPHFVVAESTQKEITNEDVEALLMADMTGTPAPIDFNPDTDLTTAFFTGTQSMGTSVWVEVNLEPGYLALLCFFPDVSDGMPHAYHGMHNVVKIEG